MEKDKKKNQPLRKVLEKPVWFAFPAIILSFVLILLLVFTSFYKLFLLITEVFGSGLITMDSGFISAEILGIIDIFLLVILIYIMAITMYRFFIGPIYLGTWLKIETLTDFKITIAKTIVMFLVTFSVHKIVEWKEPTEIFYFIISISVVCALLICYIVVLRRYLLSDEKAKD